MVVHPQLGVTVLEVKDWIEITEANPDSVMVRPRDGAQRSETNPIKQSRGKAIAIANRLQAKTSLLHHSGPHQGKLKIPWGYAAVFPNLTRMMLDW